MEDAISLKEQLLQKIHSRNITVGVVGQGYVGLPLAVNFALADIPVIGFEKDAKKVEWINGGRSYIADVSENELQSAIGEGRLCATEDFARIGECDAVIICVPTPLDEFRKPDLKYVEDACTTVGRYMKKGVFVCLESTTFPTTTEDYVAPTLEKVSGYKKEEDFWVAFSPERVDPGNQKFTIRNTVKIIGALSPDGMEIGMDLYAYAVETLHPVSSPRVAEMAKILENTYRLVNISLVNELALLANRMDINLWEAIDAAKTKPYGFQAFYPGPGIGGHCIPLDPFYLEYIATRFNFDLTMIHTAGQINTLMPHRMMIRINFALNRIGKALKGTRILFLGVAYKPDISDDRESPALKIIDEVVRKGAIVSYCDPYIPFIKTEAGHTFDSVPFDESTIAAADCVVITTRHSRFNYELILANARQIVDLQNVYKVPHERVVKL
ncbi:MAG: nucleotide sugar dehydrogenase [Deltaproteobacteria bacterium]|nr:nucleotide sugar dehydrogenase [Deltaproteobacteria bacterium]